MAMRDGNYWPDYHIKQRRRGSWIAPVLLLVLVAALLVGGAASLLRKEQAEEPLRMAGSGSPTARLSLPLPAEMATIPLVTPSPEPKLAPDFTLLDLFDDAQTHTLSDYRNRPVILNFWASWCVPCREEMPDLEQAYVRHRDDRLLILGINQSFVDDLQIARDFVIELGLTFPNARDDDGAVSNRLYRAMMLPTSVFLSGDGQIVHRHVGQMNEDQIESYVQQILANEEK